MEPSDPGLIPERADRAVGDTGRRVVWARREAGLTQRELADRVGARLQMVDQWESGARPVPLKQLERIAEATGFDIRWFLSATEQHAAVVAALEESASLAGDGGEPHAEPNDPEADVDPAQLVEEADLSRLRAELEERERSLAAREAKSAEREAEQEAISRRQEELQRKLEAQEQAVAIQEKDVSWWIEQLEAEHRRLESHRVAETAALDEQRWRLEERAAVEDELEERLNAVTAAEVRLAARERELAERDRAALDEAPNLHEGEAVASREARAKEPYEWDLDVLAALVEEHADDHPERVERWRWYIRYLSELADGTLLTGREADALIRHVFAPLLDTR